MVFSLMGRGDDNIIFGIDPGMRSCGYAVIASKNDNSVQYITSGVIKSKKGE